MLVVVVYGPESRPPIVVYSFDFLQIQVVLRIVVVLAITHCEVSVFFKTFLVLNINNCFVIRVMLNDMYVKSEQNN
jgi:hypothetical protein